MGVPEQDTNRDESSLTRPAIDDKRPRNRTRARAVGPRRVLPAAVLEHGLVDDIRALAACLLSVRQAVVPAPVGHLEDLATLGTELLEVAALVLFPFALDQVTLIILEVRPLKLAASDREIKRGQMLAGQEARDVRRRKRRLSICESHYGKIRRIRFACTTYTNGPRLAQAASIRSAFASNRATCSDALSCPPPSTNALTR